MVKLYDVVSSKYHNKTISVDCIVSGKSIAPYCIPKKINIECSPKKGISCSGCALSNSKVLSVDSVDESILKFIDISSSKLSKVIREVFNVDCSFIYKVDETQNVERIFILPPTGKERSKYKLAPIGYYVGYGLEVNTPYRMEGYTTIDPSNQTVTHVFTKAIKMRSDLDSFVMSETENSELSEFCISNPTVEKIYDYLEDLYEFYSCNITKIYHRFDLHLAIDLSFKSVLSFQFDNEYVHKGWMDVMVIGDTRCGKGYVTERLTKYFGLGEIVSGDMCSLAGLIGGLQQFNGHWVTTWGKIPLNDGGIVIVDESGEIDPSDWAKLSKVRSEGVAEITKINSQTTNARTRIIFLANPPLKTISNYSYGIQAVKDIVKAPEDIARFDYVLVVSHNEVSMGDINKHRDLVKSKYTGKLEQDLILWVWSRKSKDIAFSNGAIELVYDLSVKLSRSYSFSLPLIQGENIRIKLAKLAIGFAGRLYSNRNEGRTLYVDKVHVECAYYFLNLIYKKESCGYYSMSQLQKERDMEYSERDFTSIDDYLNAFSRYKREICKCLLNNNNILANDLSEHINLDMAIAREIVSTLLKNSCIVKKFNYYVKTPAFVSYLKKKIFE